MILQHKVVQYQIVQDHHPRCSLGCIVDTKVCGAIAHMVQNGVVWVLFVVVCQRCQWSNSQICRKERIGRHDAIVDVECDVDILRHIRQEFFGVVRNPRVHRIDGTAVGDTAHECPPERLLVAPPCDVVQRRVMHKQCL